MTAKLIFGLIMAGALAVWVPWGLGFGFFDPLLLLIYQTLAPVFMAGRALTPPRWPQDVLPRTFVAALIGWGCCAALTAAGIAVVNLTGGYPEFVWPGLPVLAGLLLAGLGLALFAAGVGAAVSAAWDDSPLAAILYRALYLLPFVLYIGLPAGWQAGLLAMLSPAAAPWFGLRAAAIGVAAMILFGRFAQRQLAKQVPR
jgi:hypothetical protein